MPRPLVSYASTDRQMGEGFCGRGEMRPGQNRLRDTVRKVVSGVKPTMAPMIVKTRLCVYAYTSPYNRFPAGTEPEGQIGRHFALCHFYLRISR